MVDSKQDRYNKLVVASQLKLSSLHEYRVPFLCNDSIPLTDIEREVVLGLTEANIERLLDGLLIDWRNDHNTQDTPRRMAKMLVNETFRGRYDPLPSITEFPNVKKVDQLLVVGPVDVKSTCAHHFQPFVGKAWVGILPSAEGKLTGLSKYARLVDYYSRRPQIQEELTAQIADHLQDRLQPDGLIVVVKARHLCMLCRGVNQDSWTTTSVAHGSLRNNPSTKQEFFALVGDMSC